MQIRILCCTIYVIFGPVGCSHVSYLYIQRWWISAPSTTEAMETIAEDLETEYELGMNFINIIIFFVGIM